MRDCNGHQLPLADVDRRNVVRELSCSAENARLQSSSRLFSRTGASSGIEVGDRAKLVLRV